MVRLETNPLKPDSKAKQKQGKQGTPTTQQRPQHHATWTKKSHIKRNLVILFAIVIVVGLGVYSLSQATPPGQAITVSSTAWKTAPLTDARTGQNFTLSQFQGKVVMLELMATYCQYCHAEGQQMILVQQRLGGNSQVVLVTVDVDSREELGTLQRYVQANPGFGNLNSDPLWYYAKDNTGQLMQSIAAGYDLGSYIAQTPTYIIDRAQSNNFSLLLRSSLQEANSASDIITAINKALA